VNILNGQYNTIGGSTAAARNVISGNSMEGVYIDTANFNTVSGNYIGTDACGTNAIANNIGIYCFNTSNTTIGGTAAGAGNVISGNTNRGIDMDWGISGNVIQGNYIGTNAYGNAVLANITGIWANHTTSLTIGGTAAGSGNLISGNSGVGVEISDDDSPGSPSTVCVQGNSIYSNGGLGIELGGNGVPNYLQNFPVLASAASGSQFTVLGSLNSTPNSTFCIDVYANTSADPTGYGEGQTYLGYVNVTTNGSGKVTAVDNSSGTAAMVAGTNNFVVSFNASVSSGQYISATATNLVTNATSKFSQCVTAAAPGITVTPATSQDNPLLTTEGGQTTFSVVLTGVPSGDVTIGLSSSDSTEGTISTPSLTFTPGDWNVAQTVTVNGVNDNLVDGDIAYTITTAPAISPDSNYSNRDAADVSMKTIDNGYNTVVVTNNSDVVNGTVTSIAALYADPGTDGISLREAILASNATPNGPGGPDRIYFNISGAGVHTIAPLSAQGNIVITDPVIIDGYTQSGALANTLALGDNAALMIELSGVSAGSGANGLTLGTGSSGSTIRGLAIDRFSGSGISVLTDNNTIAGDFIGTNPAQGTGLGNGSGVSVSGSGNMIGGTTADARNLICNNTGAGVVVSGASASGDSILGNKIYSNGGLGIDLVGNDTAPYGVTPNDGLDGDTGPNNLQNFPVIISPVIYNNQLIVKGTLDAAVRTTYRIEVFSNDAQDTSGYGEGQYLLGSFNVTTDGNGHFNFDDTPNNANVLNVVVTPGKMISATATRLTAGNQPTDTSEFSQCVAAAVPGIKVTPLTGLVTTEAGGQTQFTVALSTQPTTDVTISLAESTPTKGSLWANAGCTTPISSITFNSTNWNTPIAVYVKGVDDTYVEDATGPYSTAYTITASVTSTGDAIYNKNNANVAPVALSLTNTDNDLFSTIYVTTTTDNNDVTDASGHSITSYSPAYLINNPGADGAISLREAIIASNYATNSYMSNGVDVRDRIYFNIPVNMGQLTTYSDSWQAYTYTINVQNLGPDTNRGLPIIASNCKVIIDATTQPIYKADGSVQPGPATRPIVALDGGSWTNSSKAGFTIASADVAIRGFAIGNFNKGVYNSGNADIVVQTCYIGTDITGTQARANTTGISFSGNNDASTIGGPLASQGCVISGNTGAGISLAGSKTNLTLIENCYIGVDATGKVKMANGAQGILLAGRSNITITGNVISGNGTYGIDNGAVSGIIITSNYIGVGADGTTPIGNTSAGILMEGSTSNDTIGGMTATLGNVIAHNGGDGVKVTSTAATGTAIMSNDIFSNGGLGINVASGANPPNAPAITSATTDVSSLIRVSGTLSASANKIYRIDFFANSGTDSGGHLEGQVFLGYTTVTTDGSGHATFTTDLSANVALGQTINATTTDIARNVTGGFGQTGAADQRAGFTITLVSGQNTTDLPPSDLETREDGGTAQFSVKLNSAPLYDVTIPISSDNTAEGVISTTSLTFTQANWNVAQIVTVTGVRDHVTDGNQLYLIITGAAQTSDPLYSGLNPADVSVTSIDVDIPGIIVTPATNPLITSENGLAATFTVKLNTCPSAQVTIDLSSSNTAEGMIDKSSLRFDASNWDQEQTVTVTGQDDGPGIIGNQNYDITFDSVTSGDSHYNGMPVADVTATNIGNDTAGISVIPITPLTTTEAGGQVRFMVFLDKAPTSSVTIDLSTSDTTEGLFDKGPIDGLVAETSLTFTTDPTAADYYAKPQTVTVTGVPDNIVDGNVAYAINFAVSGDPTYSSLHPSPLSLTNTDIDTFNKIYVTTDDDILSADANTSSIENLYLHHGSDGISLREAILAANSTLNATGGPDHIYFAIPGSGVHTIIITAGSPLPPISDAVVIDGYSQPGASANPLAAGDNAVILIELNGTSAGTGANGLTLAAGSNGSTIRGLAIDRFNGSGIKVISNNNAIVGDFLGTNPGGSATGIGNGYGVYVTGANNIIGGATAAERNVISGNTTGIDVYGVTATGNMIQGNLIGTNAAGTGALANGTGILADQSINLAIGGTASGDGNLIAFNSGVGVSVSITSMGVEILGNSIYSNDGLGIDLVASGDAQSGPLKGVTLNDTGDADTGANNLQNYPVITYATIKDSTLTVHGSLNSTANTTLRIEVFANDTADGSGYGEGQTYLGSFNVTTDSSGNVNFDNCGGANVLHVSVAPGKSISATATNLTTKDTSEFALCDAAVAPVIDVSPTSGSITDKSGRQAMFTVSLDNTPTAEVDITVSTSNIYQGKIVSGSDLVSSITLHLTAANNYSQTVTVQGVNNGLGTVVEGNVLYTVATAAATSDDLNYNGVNAADVSVTNNNTNTYTTIRVTTNQDVDNVKDAQDDPIPNYNLAQLFYYHGSEGISLREAITAANNTANYYGPNGKYVNDCIYFNLPAGSRTISVTSQLPNITDAVTIDGTTNPGFAGTPIIELDGTNAGSGAIGINIRASANTIRGLVINRFSRDGIWMTNGNNTIVGCYIGTDVTGTVPLANSYYTYTSPSAVSVALYVASSGNTIGGTTAADRNIIAGNASVGIRIDGNNNTFTGNYIGVDSTGEAALGNGTIGVLIAGGYSGNTIGGTAAGAGNVISGNGSYGMDIMGPNNTVEGNHIGVSASGQRAFGNGDSGIYIESWGDNNMIGGTAVGAGNVIAYNAGNGIRVVSGHTLGVGNAILSNQIYSNTGLGIDLGGDGVTANDTGDTDAGVNDLQNFPDLLGVATNGSQVNIQGTLNSTAGRTFRIEFFANDSPDSRGYGQGRKYLGYVNVTTDSSGNVTAVGDSSGTAAMIAGSNDFVVNFHNSVSSGQYISATATNLVANDTSEFAQNAIAKAPAIVITAADGLTTSENGAAAQFSVALNAPPSSDVTIAVSSSNAGEGAVSARSLTFTPSNWNVPQTVSVAWGMDYLNDDVHYAIDLGRPTSGDAVYSNGVNGAEQPLTHTAHVNRPPILTVPAKQTTNTSVLFSPATENAIRIEDADNGANSLHVQLTATNGQLTLGSTAGLSFIPGNGSGNAAIEFLGSITDVNAALNGMKFVPSSSNGNLQITVDDQGFSGSGGPQSATANVGIEVKTPRRQSTPPPLLPVAPPSPPSPPTPTPTPAPPKNPFYVNSNSTQSFEQNNHLVRAESANGNKVIARSITNILPGNARPAEITAVDANADYLSTRDRFQTYAIQPFVTKISGANLTLQSVMDTQLLWKEIKALAAQGETLPWLSKINVGTVIGLSAGLSAGYLMMAFRWGALITSGLAATYPVWQWIDPLPILEASKDKSDNEKLFGESEQNAKSQLNESLESLIS
jgi:hypothetical protein